MTSGATKGLISSVPIYGAEVYEAAAKGSTYCMDPEINIESTNVVMQILKEKIIDRLPKSQVIEQQLMADEIDTETSKKIEAIFQTIGFTPSTTEGPPVDEERRDIALRTANLFRSKFTIQLTLLVRYVCDSKKFSKKDAAKSVLGTLFGNSLSGLLGSKVLDVFDADLVIQENRLAVARQKKAAASQELATASQELATARQEKAEAEKTIARERARAIGYAGVRRIIDKLDAGYHFPKGYHFP